MWIRRMRGAGAIGRGVALALACGAWVVAAPRALCATAPSVPLENIGYGTDRDARARVAEEPLRLAAAFAPGAAPAAEESSGEANTGGGAEAASGNGLVLAPIRYWGLVALDYRHRRSPQLGDSNAEVLSATVNAASYIWQPWFMQVRGGIGMVGAYDRQANAQTARNVNGIGYFDLGLFPVSRFPFNFYADASDSRSGGDLTGVDYRSTRYRVSQAYSPADRNERYFASFEQSNIKVTDGGGAFSSGAQAEPTANPTDVLRVWRATFNKGLQNHSFDVDGARSQNRRVDVAGSYDTRIDTANATHAYNPSPALSVNSLASYSRTNFDLPRIGAPLGADLPPTRSDTQFLQFSSFANYRPQPGDWLSSPDHPFYSTATLRAFRFTNQFDGRSSDSQGASGSLGFSYNVTQYTQLFSSTQIARTESEGDNFTGFAQSLGANYAPLPIPLGDYRYIWSTGASGVYASTTGAMATQRESAQASFNHALTRTLRLSEADTVSFNVGQSVSERFDSEQSNQTTLTHTASSFWNGVGGASRQTFAGLTLSDSRRFGAFAGEFQLVNFQLTRQEALSRVSTWTGNVTYQATRAREDTGFTDAFGASIDSDQGKWRYSYGANVTYVNVRAFGVPRLRYTGLLIANSFDVDRRASGNIDGPLERIDWAFENRLDYAIGRIDVRLTARLAEVEGRGKNFLLFLRIQRSFGQP